jgi:NADPH:quinone reductase-like Zn-dependent oxidoreductase
MREDAIVVRDRRRFGEQVKAAALVASGGVSDECDVVMDAVMGDFFKGGWDNLAKTGRYVVYGAADLTPGGRLGFKRLGQARVEVRQTAVRGPDESPRGEQVRDGV